MSRVAILTGRYEEMFTFYHNRLGLTPVRSWDREGARGVVLRWLDGLMVELLDAQREKTPPVLGQPADRIHLVLVHPQLAPYLEQRGWGPGQTASWCRCFFRTRDPDGNPICLMEPWSAENETATQA